MRNDPKGANWRKWDLHVHTPASLRHNYPGGSEKAWEDFIDDLERLPEHFKVIGINDYIFIDGYRRVLDYKGSGRLKNIDLILPVIELRLDKFGGTNSSLSRVNFHIIFSNEVPPDHIESFFLNGLSREFQLSHTFDGKPLKWNAIVTQESLRDLGKMVKESVPAEQLGKFGSDEIEGFNNINFAYENVLQLLESHYFSGKHLTAIGKTEWGDIKWNEQSVADKKNIIARADFIFISAESIEAYHKARESLQKSQVNDRLLDCSDAHSLSSSMEKDRVGKCFTWIKADPTFDGLLHVVKGFNERAFVGEIPEKFTSVRSSPTKYVSSLKIKKRPDVKFNEQWFDGNETIEFNHGLVAVIGNKGSAKSALTDIIGLLGNTKNHSHFSFLSQHKFRQPANNKAKHFEATMTWESGLATHKPLDATVSGAEVESIKYIPQNFFESVCNEVEVKEDSDFDKELEEVIFSHVENPDRLGQTSLRELIEYRTSEIHVAIEQLKIEIRAINKKIVTTETYISEEYRKSILNKLETKKQELEGHRKTKPPKVPNPDTVKGDEAKASVLPEIEKKKKTLEQLEIQIKDAEKRQAEIAAQEAAFVKAINKVDNFSTYHRKAQKEFDELELGGITFADIVKVEINKKPLETAKAGIDAEKKKIGDLLNLELPESLLSQKRKVQLELKALQLKLKGRDKEYQEYQKAIEAWKVKEKEILSEKPDDSIKHYETLLQGLEKMPQQLEEQKSHRALVVGKIYSQLEKLATSYKELYAPVQNFIQQHPLAHKFSLNFDASIVDKGFKVNFFDWINQGMAGTFCGKAEGAKALDAILLRYDFNKLDDVLAFLDEIASCLSCDIRKSPPTMLNVTSQLRKGKTVESLYDFIFSLGYLKPHYILKMGEKEMHQLSPGEKGALLLVFYLLVDKNDIPLVIDQPEENLDNQTVVELLVPSIGEARQRRQIFIVTHNPNLAVVCDSDQIICASMDKKNGNRVEYFTGSIENREVNQRLLDILEGTRPAFNKRQSKYIPEYH